MSYNSYESERRPFSGHGELLAVRRIPSLETTCSSAKRRGIEFAASAVHGRFVCPEIFLSGTSSLFGGWGKIAVVMGIVHRVDGRVQLREQQTWMVQCHA